MKFADTEPPSELVYIHRPSKRSAVIYGEWLLAAARANAALKQIRKTANSLPGLTLLDSSCIVDIELIALYLLERLFTSDPLRLLSCDQDGEDIVLLVSLGLIAKKRGGWTLSIPSVIEAADVERAIETLSTTEDKGCMLHPETLPPFAGAA